MCIWSNFKCKDYSVIFFLIKIERLLSANHKPGLVLKLCFSTIWGEESVLFKLFFISDPLQTHTWFYWAWLECSLLHLAGFALKLASSLHHKESTYHEFDVMAMSKGCRSF
jgi:hypothetical protein